MNNSTYIPSWIIIVVGIIFCVISFVIIKGEYQKGFDENILYEIMGSVIAGIGVCMIIIGSFIYIPYIVLVP